MSKCKKLSTLISFLVFIECSKAANILGFLILPFVSHHICLYPIFKELASKGHNVTLITPLISNETSASNIREVDIEFIGDVFNQLQKDVMKKTSMVYGLFYYYDILINTTRAVLEKDHVRKVFTDTDYDLVVVENISPLAFAPVLLNKAPVIGITSFEGFLNAQDAVGNPVHPIINPHFFLHQDIDLNEDLPFFSRLISTILNFTLRVIYKYYAIPSSDTIAKDMFGDNLESLGDIERNLSLTIYSSNPIVNTIKANVPSAIEISLTHIKSPDKLPKDINTFIDNSKRGVIYFSLGTNEFCTERVKNKIHIIKEVINNLPYDVIWKWDDDTLYNSENFLIKKWLPQQDILSHPKVKLFVTQGGLQSAEEGIYYGVPIVGIPIMYDQETNVRRMVQMGIGERLNLEHLGVKNLTDLIVKVANTSHYREKVNELSKLIKDQPMTGVDKAVWWMEYVIRHKGALHLRGKTRKLPMYQYYLLDVLFFIAVFLLVILFGLFKFVQVLLRLFRRLNNIKLKIKQN
ncbi:unnamed protein product [Brassicogethes aeneus]|uniref:UDP-glucuronosyltransferase n=1 Tax=Brassicogethes aeneus TaxID=1431903 RepID=A0A9P0FBD0_BRAAE|nr:unnamed protein product [Brassicogethes aeneus]